MPVDVTGSAVNILVQLQDGKVSRSPGQSLKADVAGFRYDIGGVRGIYLGAVSQTVADDETNFVYLDSAGSLQIKSDIDDFPTTTIIPLARVITANGEIIDIIPEHVLLASSSSSVGECIISYPVDGDIRGGETAASSNNDYAAIRYNDSATGDGRNRWNRIPPQNYVSGDLTLRIIYSWATSPDSNADIVLKWSWSFRDFGQALGSWDGTDQQTIVVDSENNDALLYKDLTMPAEDFDIAADLMMMKFQRLGNDGEDTCNQNMYVHEIELIYTGILLAGQPGQ